MKIVKKTKDSRGDTLYWLVVNKEELKLLRGIVENTLVWMPKVFTTTIKRGRLRNMANIFTSSWKGRKVKVKPPLIEEIR